MSNGVPTSEIRGLVQAVLAELAASADSAAASRTSPSGPSGPSGASSASSASTGVSASAPGRPPTRAGGEVVIDVPDPTLPEARHRIGVRNPANATALANLASSTGARLAVGRAGPRPPTWSTLLFGADHAVTQDAIFGDVPEELLERFGLFTVQTQVQNQDEYLLRPDLGRRLSEEGRATVAQRCASKPQVQIVVGDGLSAAAVTNNLPEIYPVLEQGLSSAGLRLGTPFFVRFCRVGLMNDVNDIVQADVVVLLIGERPGLGVADALSAYSGWRPTAGKTDAHRDVICMITAHGGTNPLEAGAFVVEHVKNVIAAQASGVELRLQQSEGR